MLLLLVPSIAFPSPSHLTQLSSLPPSILTSFHIYDACLFLGTSTAKPPCFCIFRHAVCYSFVLFCLEQSSVRRWSVGAMFFYSCSCLGWSCGAYESSMIFFPILFYLLSRTPFHSSLTYVHFVHAFLPFQVLKHPLRSYSTSLTLSVFLIVSRILTFTKDTSPLSSHPSVLNPLSSSRH